MAVHEARIVWTRSNQAFLDNRYSRDHDWHFDGNVTVPASASDKILPSPLSSLEAVDPEEAFVAALSSCHMLFFLANAARAGFIVDRYEDTASGSLGDRDGKKCITSVQLHPRVRFHGARPAAAQLVALHESAHHNCYLANSVTSFVACQPEIME